MKQMTVIAIPNACQNVGDASWVVASNLGAKPPKTGDFEHAQTHTDNTRNRCLAKARPESKDRGDGFTSVAHQAVANA